MRISFKYIFGFFTIILGFMCILQMSMLAAGSFATTMPYKTYDFSNGSTEDFQRKNYNSTLFSPLTDTDFNYWTTISPNTLLSNTYDAKNPLIDTYNINNNSVALAGDDRLEDYYIQSTFNIIKGDTADFLVRYDKTKDTFYQVSFSDKNNTISIYKGVSIIDAKLISSFPYNITKNTDYTVAVGCTGNEISVYVQENGTFILKNKSRDSEYQSGKYGFKATIRTKVMFKDIKILNDLDNVKRLSDISIFPSSGNYLNVLEGDMIGLNVLGRKTDGTFADLTNISSFSTSSPSNISMLNNKGLFQAMTANTLTQVTANLNGLSDNINIKVLPWGEQFEYINLTQIPYSLATSRVTDISFKKDILSDDTSTLNINTLNTNNIIYNTQFKAMNNVYGLLKARYSEGHAGLILCLNPNTKSFYKFSLTSTGIECRKMMAGKQVDYQKISYGLSNFKKDVYKLEAFFINGGVNLLVDGIYVGRYEDKNFSAKTTLLNQQQQKEIKDISKKSGVDYIFDLGNLSRQLNYYIKMDGLLGNAGSVYFEKLDGKKWIVVEKQKFDFTKKTQITIEGLLNIQGKARIRFTNNGLSPSQYTINILRINSEIKNICSIKTNGATFQTIDMAAGFYSYNYKVKGSLRIYTEYYDGKDWITVSGALPIKVIGDSNYKEYAGIIYLPYKSIIRVRVVGTGSIGNLGIMKPLIGGYSGIEVDKNSDIYLYQLLCKKSK